MIRKMNPEQGEERDADHSRRGGEVPVAEQAHVEDRVVDGELAADEQPEDEHGPRRCPADGAGAAHPKCGPSMTE